MPRTAPPAVPARAGLARLPGRRAVPGDRCGAEQHLADLRRRVILKVLRKVGPGLNPDIELHSALVRAGETAGIARPLGWLEGRWVDSATASSSTEAWRSCRSSSTTPPRAGRWPRPACATCSPRETCTPTRWAGLRRREQAPRDGDSAGARRARQGAAHAVLDRDGVAHGRRHAGPARRSGGDSVPRSPSWPRRWAWCSTSSSCSVSRFPSSGCTATSTWGR
jgi:hypothetical protein